MQISLIAGFVPFLLSFAVIILSNVLKFNSEIKSAQKYPLLRSFVQLVIFYITASMENAEILDNECLIALNSFLVLFSAILLYCSFAVQAAAFVILLIKSEKAVIPKALHFHHFQNRFHTNTEALFRYSGKITATKGHIFRG